MVMEHGHRVAKPMRYQCPAIEKLRTGCSACQTNGGRVGSYLQCNDVCLVLERPPKQFVCPQIREFRSSAVVMVARVPSKRVVTTGI